jgi:hypothetical protein
MRWILNAVPSTAKAQRTLPSFRRLRKFVSDVPPLSARRTAPRGYL